MGPVGRRLSLSCSIGLTILAVGCGAGGGTQTYPVQGRVVYKSSGNVNNLVGGRVRLQSESDPAVMPVGEIEEGGVFSVGTFVNNQALQGVPAGKYKARVEPPQPDSDDGVVRRFINPRYQNFASSGLTVTVPVSGEVVLTVEAYKR